MTAPSPIQAPVCGRCQLRHDPALPCWQGRLVGRLRAQVLAVYGDMCHLCRGGGADSPDHLRPRSQWGSDDIANLRPSHRVCNRLRGDGPAPGWEPKVIVVTGPPGAGKSAYVAVHAQPGHVKIDLDDLVAALTVAGDSHDAARIVAAAARGAAVRAALRLPPSATVWIVHGQPTEQQLTTYRNASARIVTVDPGADVTAARLTGRPAARAVAARWYLEQQQPAAAPRGSPGLSARFRIPDPEGAPT